MKIRLCAIAAIIGFVCLVGCENRQSTILAYRLASGYIFIAEDGHHPGLQELRRNERLDNYLLPYKDKPEIEQLIALMQWSKNLFPATTPFPNYPPWDANTILRMIREKKTGAFCAQYAFVFGQACQSLGYHIRYYDLARRIGGNGHFMLEVYVPSLRKWVAFEPEFGHVFQNDKKEFLGAVELHEYALGKKGKIFNYPQNVETDSDFIKLYTRIRYYLRNNFLSMPVYCDLIPQAGGHRLVFETDRLSYSRPTGKPVPRGSEEIFSPNKNDFVFELNLDILPVIPVKTYADFIAEMKKSEPNRIYRFRINESFYDGWEKQWLGNDHRYVKLSTGLEELK